MIPLSGVNRAPFRLKLIPDSVLVCLVLAACALWEGGCGSSRLVEPTDQELISTFQTHRQVFEELQQMASDDAQRGWYLGASDPSKLDQSRQNEYKKLISGIRPGPDVAMNGSTGVVRFIFAGKGSAIGPGWAKGIEYVPGDYKSEGVPLANLDNASNLPARVYIRQLEPRWFVFYQRDE
jgi:hypothetical protein